MPPCRMSDMPAVTGSNPRRRGGREHNAAIRAAEPAQRRHAREMMRSTLTSTEPRSKPPSPPSGATPVR